MKKILLFILSLSFIYVAITLYDANILKTIEFLQISNCKTIDRIEGPEDMKAVGDYLLVSSTSLEKRSSRGNLFLLNKDLQLLNLTKEIDFTFYPHGIDVFRLEDGYYRVFVVNHRFEKRSSVEIFDLVIEDYTLEHIKTVESPHFYNLNDVAALDDGQFFVSRDHFFKNHYLKLLENFFRMGLGKVFYFNGSDVVDYLGGFNYTNGLALDLDSNTLYVASMTGRNIKSFDISEIDSVRPLDTFQFNYFPDNIALMSDKRELIIGAHPKIFELKKHSENPEKDLSASIILKLDIKSGNVEKIFSDDGNLISGASIALFFHDYMVIGNIFQHHLLVCPSQ